MPSNMYNFPVRVTAANIAMQYMMAVRMVRVMNVVVGFMGLAIVIACVHRWAMVLVYVSLGLMAAVLVAYFCVGMSPEIIPVWIGLHQTRFWICRGDDLNKIMPYNVINYYFCTRE